MKNSIQKSKSSSYLLMTVFAILAVVCFFFFIAASNNTATKDIEITRTAFENWIVNQRLISKEKRDLAISLEILNERIELVETEIMSLEEKIGQAEQSIAEADKKRAELLEENEKLKNASDSVKSNLFALEDRIRQLIKLMPNVITKKIKPLSQRLPDKSKECKLSLSERFQNVVGILNEVDKFNNEITLTSEIRTLEDGRSFEVSTVYLGLGQGYYASSNGEIAGVGMVLNGRWNWRQMNEYAGEILEVIAILNNEKVASFVRLPVQIR
jgi:septal ring factor EnvC (AmiA/AmiB activator)